MSTPPESTPAAAAEPVLRVPLGFRWGAVAAGIRYRGRDDLAMAAADAGAVPTAAVFTRNAFAAAPVLLCREILAATGGRAAAIIVNSGCANAATGPQGMADARAMAAAATAVLGQPGADPAAAAALPASTGTIGVALPMPKVLAGISAAASALAATPEGFLALADAILTTDTVRKTATAAFDIDGRTVRIAACAKGSGMMQPKMATMLAFAFTDADVDPATLQAVFARAVDGTLNCVTVDGDTSTNDTAVLMASGASGVRVEATDGATDGGGATVLAAFETALTAVLRSLARQLARDGEGATKLVEIVVTGAADVAEARTAGLAIANSPLVKTAIHGRDANWGRIACAIGNSGVPVDPDRVSIKLGPLLLFANGAPLPLDEAAALAVLSAETVTIHADLGRGDAGAEVFTCDLSARYIEINGSYRT